MGWSMSLETHGIMKPEDLVGMSRERGIRHLEANGWVFYQPFSDYRADFMHHDGKFMRLYSGFHEHGDDVEFFAGVDILRIATQDEIIDYMVKARDRSGKPQWSEARAIMSAMRRRPNTLKK